jgi:hypothetical protein
MAILKMPVYRYSKSRAEIFERKGSGFTSYGLGFCLDVSRDKSPSEELLKAVLKFDPEFKHCAERQLKTKSK